MKVRSLFLIPLYILVNMDFVFAQSVTTITSTKQNFVNTNCAVTDSCHLKKAFLLEENYKVQMSKTQFNYGTRMVTAYQTESVKQLEEYGFVQFIKGCQFSSFVDKNNKVVKRMDISRPFYGDSIPYRHINWVIDNFTRDPIEWGETVRPDTRHFFYRFLESAKASFFGDTKYYGYEEPKVPVLFVRDRPGTAFYEHSYKEAKNISLEFKTCLYKAAQVPRDVPPEKLDFAKPLECFTWSSSYIYNFSLGQFESPKEIDPFCKSEAMEEILN